MKLCFRNRLQMEEPGVCSIWRHVTLCEDREAKQSLWDFIQCFKSQLVTVGQDQTWSVNHKTQLPLHFQEIFFPIKTAPAPGQPEEVYCCFVCKQPFTLLLNNTHKTWCRLPRVMQNHEQNWTSLKKYFMPQRSKNHTGNSPKAPAVIYSSASWPRAEVEVGGGAAVAANPMQRPTVFC